MSVLAGALSASDVVEVTDDAAALRAAARRFAAATEGVLTSATSGSTSWATLPTVFTSEALQPALTPLMDPAVQKSRQVQAAGEEFEQVALRAATSIEALQHRHDALVAQIEQFHASAPGRVAAEASAQAASGNLLGAVGTVVDHWQQVPALVTEELDLRMQVQSYNDDVSSTMQSIAAQFDAITPSAVDAHPVHTAADISGSGSGSGSAHGNWFEDAWNTTKAAVGLGGAVLGAEAEAMWPHVQDAAAVAGNIFASLGNAMVEHPDETLELLGGLAVMAGGSAMEVGGGALDLTGVGAIGGVPLNIAGAGVIAAGAGMAATGATQLGVHAMTDDQVSPNRTDHVEQARKDPNGPNKDHPGRNNKGEYRSEDNDKARVDSAQKEAKGIDQYEAEHGVKVTTTQKVRAQMEGATKERVYDGLVKKPDGTWEGIEVKSGKSADKAQEAFDRAVSYDHPAYAKLNGERIEITSVDYQRVN